METEIETDTETNRDGDRQRHKQRQTDTVASDRDIDRARDRDGDRQTETRTERETQTWRKLVRICYQMRYNEQPEFYNIFWMLRLEMKELENERKNEHFLHKVRKQRLNINFSTYLSPS